MQFEWRTYWERFKEWGLCQIQLVSMVTMICFRKLPFDHIQGFMIMPELILFVILLIDLKQLFQRKWWPTI